MEASINYVMNYVIVCSSTFIYLTMGVALLEAGVYLYKRLLLKE